MTIMSIRRFEDSNHANIYAKFRPTVPRNVINNVLNFLKQNLDSSQWDIAVDVGCGSGQGTNEFSPYFKHVYGFDVSPVQIEAAKQSQHSPNVLYDVSPAETLPKIQSNSVQLLTACEAAHYFDLQEFFKESDRILVKDGVVALIGYFLPELVDPSNPDDQRILNVMNEVHSSSELAPLRSARVQSVEKHYHDFKFPDNYEYVHQDNIIHSFKAYAQDLVGLVESWSHYQGLVAKDKLLADQFIENFEQKLKHILGVDDLSSKRFIWNYTYFIAMGRKIK